MPTLEFPCTWLEKTPPEAMLKALEAMEKHGILAANAAVVSLDERSLTEQDSFLIERMREVDTFHWLSLDEKLRRQIAYDVMEFKQVGPYGGSLEEQCRQILHDDPDEAIYEVYMTSRTITVVNTLRLEELFEQGDLADVEQTSFDNTVLCLVVQPHIFSAHSLLQVQRTVDEKLKAQIQYLVPEEISVDVPRLVAPSRI